MSSPGSSSPTRTARRRWRVVTIALALVLGGAAVVASVLGDGSSPATPPAETATTDDDAASPTPDLAPTPASDPASPEPSPETTPDDGTTTTPAGDPDPDRASRVSTHAVGESGIVTLERIEQELRVREVVAADGWYFRVSKGRGEKVTVEFRTDERKLRLEAELEDGEVRTRIRGDDEDDEDSDEDD